MSKKLTPWFSGRKKPVRPGVYQRNYAPRGATPCIVYCRFDMLHWYCYEDSAIEASYATTISVNEKDPWRGLVKDEE